MADDVVLRPLRWPDLATAARIEAESFDFDPWSVETLWSELAGVPDRRYYVACSAGDQLLGYAGLSISGSDCDVQTVVVVGDQRGYGYGRALLADVIERGRDRGCTRCHLEVREDAVGAIALYESAGFEPLARRRNYYGRGVDAVIMRLDLRMAS